MDIYDKKEYFVRTSLKELILDISDNILDMYYKHQDEEEWVVVCYISKEVEKVVNVDTICVTGDNLLGITKDVLKHIIV